ncbi:MAG: DUF104 domain-containing protein [Caldilineaceae bacterium]|nr:DUF104 domain-containing protein [Caldilineaceae bacterium]
MSEQTIQAIYHEGVFHPEIPGEVSLHEGRKVELSIKKIEEDTQAERSARIERIKNIIEHFYDDVDDNEIDEIERAILRRVTFVGDENKAQFD